MDTELVAPDPGSKLGIALQTLKGDAALHGLRHLPVNGTNGWYIWAGDKLESGADFFEPLHIEHASNYLGNAIKYLGLPPGWRFLIKDDHEDIWFDESIVHE